MRVALFLDGKNFYAGWRAAGRPRIGFPALARWLVARAGGDRLAGAYYYTSVETGEAADTPSQEALRSYLEMLDLQSGYFVRRFPLPESLVTCPECGTQHRSAADRGVNTELVADALVFAAHDAYDVAVLVSGDADLTPAAEGVRALGRQAFVATWGKSGLSRRLRQAAFDHIDLSDGTHDFADLPGDHAPGGSSAEGDPGSFPDDAEGRPAPGSAEESALFVDEVRRAEETFQEGYVGLNYFLTRWKSERMPIAPEERRRILDAAVDDEIVEIYEAPDGAKALRAPPSED